MGDRIDLSSIAEYGAKDTFGLECLDLLTPYYEDPVVPLRYAETREATDVYSFRRANGRLESVFFARRPEIIHSDLPPTAYMGLTVERRGTGESLARMLWRRFLTDIRSASGPTAPILAWYRTATPFGLFPAHKLLRNGAPASDGTLSQAASHAIALIRSCYGLAPAEPNDHPCVVRGYAQARYSDAERIFIDAYRRERPDDILSQLGVEDRAGDRLLMVGWVP